MTRTGGRLTRVISMAICLASCAACGSPTSSSDGGGGGSATLTTYQGSWKGVAKRQSCTGTYCDAAFQLAFFQLDLTAGSGQLTGTLKIGGTQLTVTGTLESSGALKLTGSGSSVGTQLSLNIASWQTTVASNALSGIASLGATTTTTPSTTGTIGVSLEKVFKQGTTEASASLPLELRFAIRAKDAYAADVDRGSGFPRTVEYGGCHYIDNAAPVSVTLAMDATPVGSDGRDYDVQPITYNTSSQPNNFLDCHAAAVDSNVTRPKAPNVRLRVAYSYSDGLNGVYQIVVPVR